MERRDIEAQVEELSDGHLSELSLEAYVGDRSDLLAASTRAHLVGCAHCSELLAQARIDARVVGSALEVPFGEDELASMIAEAMEVPVSSPLRASTRSLQLAALAAASLALGLGLLSLDGAPSIGDATSALSRAFTFASISDRLVSALVPGSWAGLSLLLSGFLLMLALPFRSLLLGARSVQPHLSATALVLLVGTVGSGLAPASARALDFEGTWPAEEQLTVVVDGEPASVALERAAEAAGLGFVGALAVDPPVHLRVRGASLRDVVSAVLGADAPLVAERTPTLLILRARAEATDASPATVTLPAVIPAPPSVPALPSVPAPPSVPGRVERERVSMGGDVVVRSGEVVESVFAMGGNATIQGEVLREAVAMGGNVVVEGGGLVHGDVTALGGSVHVHRGGVVQGETGALGGEVRFDDGAPTGSSAVVFDPEPPPPDSASALAEWVGETFASGARHALLFLFGLLLLGLTPTRLELVITSVVAQPGRAALSGVLSLLGSLVLGIVLLITIVGIPGAVLLGLAAALAVYAGLVAVALVVGRALPIAALEKNPVLQLGAGILTFFVASRVPVVGPLAVIIAGLLGLGAVVLTRAGTRPSP
jgi:hypothetical protein